MKLMLSLITATVDAKKAGDTERAKEIAGMVEHFTREEGKQDEDQSGLYPDK